MSCNTCKPLLKVSSLFQIPRIIPAAFTTSKIPGNQVLCLNSVIINSQPWILFIVKSHILFSSDPLPPCAHYSCIFRIDCVSACILFIPDLTSIAPPFSLTNAMPVDSYIRHSHLYDMFMFKYQLLFLSLTT